MRFRPRPTPTELVNTTTTSPSSSPSKPYPPDATEIPLKAQSFLGAKPRVTPTPSAAPRINTPEPLRELLATHESADLRSYTSAADSSNDTTPVAQQLMPWPGTSHRPHNFASSHVPSTSTFSTNHVPSTSNFSTNHVPSTSNSSTAGAHHSGPSRNDSGQSVRPSQFYSEQQKPSLDPAGHYEAAAQPLYVSQQTSASAVRDMALRKGSPTVQEIANAPQPASARPLKSAMKQPKLQKDPSRARQPKKLDITSLFPPSRSSPVSAKWSASPSPQTEVKDMFPPETVRAQIRRQGPDGRFETYKELVPPSTESLTATKTAPRVKIFDADVYDETKLHKRRPPKGIQNWFDGFDISSDEEEKTAPTTAELPAEELVAWAKPTRSPVVAPNGMSEKPHMNHRHSLLVPQEFRRANSRSQTSGRNRPQRANSSSSTLNGSMSSAALADASKRHVDSRLAHSQLDTESVLALSSDSDNERRDLSPVRDSRLIEKASATVLQRPSIPPRKIHSKSNLAYDEAVRKSTSTAQTSGSIPIRLTDSMEVPPLPHAPSTVTSPRESEYPSSSRAHDSILPSSPNQSHHQPRSNATKPPSRSSATAETTTSSVPTDAAHMMAVTDEEMMLLELMRQKRAAMAKDSFAEGYRLALQQEEEHLARKRTSAHAAAVRMLREKEKLRALEKTSAEVDARAGSAPRDNVDHGKRRKNVSITSDEARERRNRYSMIRKGSVDKNFRLGRFLDMEAAAAAGTSSEDDLARDSASSPPPATLARLERFLVMKPSLMDAIQDTRPLSGTEIETETQTETEGEGTFDEGYTIDEDDEVDEKGRIVVPGAPSPMQRLTEMARASPLSSPLSTEMERERELEAELRGRGIEMHGGLERRESDEAKTLLTRTSRSASAGEFPAPPGGDGGRGLYAPSVSPEESRENRRSFVDEAFLEEESGVPGIPTRNPHRSPLPGVADARTPTTAAAGAREAYPSPPSPTDIHLSQHYLPPHQQHQQYQVNPPRLPAPHERPQPLRAHPILPDTSPSLPTSRPSPLTPTFTPPQPTNIYAVDEATPLSSSADREVIKPVKYRPLKSQPIVTPGLLGGRRAASGSGSATGSELDGDASSFREAVYHAPSPEVIDTESPAPGPRGPERGVHVPPVSRKDGVESAMGVLNGSLDTGAIHPAPRTFAPDLGGSNESSRAARKPAPPRLHTQGQPLQHYHTGAVRAPPTSNPASASIAPPHATTPATPATAVTPGTPASTVQLQRMASPSSITSAGEDVLAAWAELGGGGEYLLRSAGGGGWGGGQRGW